MRTLLVAGTDLRRRLRNRSAIVTAVIGPLVLAIVFSVLLGGADSASFTIGVVAVDPGPPADQAVDGLLSAPRSGEDPVTFRRVNDERTAGVLRRSLSTRAGMSTVLTGLGVGWFAWVLLQSLLIVAVGGVLFGVDWGEPLAAALLVLAFAAVGCGAGLLVGALGRNEDRVASIAGRRDRARRPRRMHDPARRVPLGDAGAGPRRAPLLGGRGMAAAGLRR